MQIEEVKLDRMWKWHGKGVLGDYGEEWDFCWEWKRQKVQRHKTTHQLG
jgi:hypothetical protein